MYANKVGKLDKMYRFLETHKLPKLTQVEIENLSRLITSNKFESVIKTLLTKKSLGLLNEALGESYKTFKEELEPQTFQKIEEEETFSNSFYEASITLIPKADEDITRKKKPTDQYLL